jgi:PAS domain S-box-containing protein
MKFLTPVSPRWYARLNEVTLVSGLLILLAYLSIEVLFTEVQADLPIRINSLSAGLSVVAVIYGLVGFRFLSLKKNLLAGLVSYLLLSCSIGTLVVATGGFESQYLLLWVVVVLFSAMFGWFMFSLTWLATHAYFTLLALNIIGHSTDPGVLVAYLIAIELPFLVSFFLWYGQNLQSNQSEDLPGEVTAGDISQGMLISSIAEGVVVIDDQNIIQVFNPAASQVSGWKSEEAKGLDYRSVLNLTDQKGKQIADNQDPISRVFVRAETVVDNDVLMRTRNDKLAELSFVASPITNKSGGVVAVVAVFRDVSKERSQERQRAEFISTASHEMRTPVAAIEGYLALAMNENVTKIDSKAREYLDKAHSSTQHLGKLFQDLLTAAKSEDGRLINHPVVVEMGSFVDSLADAIKFSAEKKGLLLEYESGLNSAMNGTQQVRPLYYTLIDPERMREVITNLFDNAVKYTAEGKITVKLTGDEQTISISVTDTGAGIPQEDLPHLFQKFYRVDNTATRQIGGTGLGLFIARKIVELNKGRIDVVSEVDVGSTFTVSIPRLDQNRASELMKNQASQDTPLANVTANVEL